MYILTIFWVYNHSHTKTKTKRKQHTSLAFQVPGHQGRTSFPVFIQVCLGQVGSLHLPAFVHGRLPQVFSLVSVFPCALVAALLVVGAATAGLTIVAPICGLICMGIFPLAVPLAALIVLITMAVIVGLCLVIAAILLAIVIVVGPIPSIILIIISDGLYLLLDRRCFD